MRPILATAAIAAALRAKARGTIAIAGTTGDAAELSASIQKPGCVPHRPSVSYPAAIGSIRLGSLFLTLPTRGLTGQQVMPSDG
jgi:hypothetical protein